MPQSERLIVNLLATSLRFGGELVVGVVLTPLLLWQLGFEVFGFLMTIGASGLLLSLVIQAVQLSVARELGFSLGTADDERLEQAFSTAFFLQLVVGILFCAVALIATPFIVAGLTVPAGYERIAHICLVLTILQLGYAIAVSPFGGLIRAHQDLQTVSLLQFLLKLSALVAALSMYAWNGNKLLFYVSALFLLSLPINSAYVVIAVRRYPEATPVPRRISLQMARTIIRFGAFSMLSFLGVHLRRNGLTVLLNVYYGNIASSASGIATRVGGLMVQVVNLIKAVVLPAMANNMGAQNVEAARRLIRIASSVVLAIAIPITVTVVTNTEAILEAWLRQDVPPLAVTLVQFVLVSLGLSFVSVGHNLALSARGDIGTLVSVSQAMVVACIAIATVCAVYFELPPWWLFAGELAGVIGAFCFWQPYWVARRLAITAREWERKTLVPAASILLACTLLAYLVAGVLAPGILRAAVVAAATLCVSVAVTWMGSLRRSEKSKISSILSRRMQAMNGKRRRAT